MPEGSEAPPEEILNPENPDANEERKLMPRVEPVRHLIDFATSKASDGFSKIDETSKNYETSVLSDSHDILDAELKGENVSELLAQKAIHERETEILEHEMDHVREELGLEPHSHQDIDEEIRKLESGPGSPEPKMYFNEDEEESKSSNDHEKSLNKSSTKSHKQRSPVHLHVDLTLNENAPDFVVKEEKSN